MSVRQRKAPPPQRPRVIINGVTLSRAQERTWRAAGEDIDSGSSGRLRRGQAALAGLESELAAARANVSIREGLDDTLALERARGEVVEVAAGRPTGGRVRVRTRDGLETLARSGAVDDLGYRAGMLYRDLYEATDPERDLRSHVETLDRRGGGRVPAAAAEAWAERRLRLAASMAVLEEKVRAADRNGHAVRALREVAGHARCIGHFVRGGGAQASYRNSLLLALSVCADHFGLTESRQFE